MNPSCKLPSYMNSLRTKMLQIPWKMRGSNSKFREIVAFSSKMLQTAGKMNRTGNHEIIPKGQKENPKQFRTLFETSEGIFKAFQKQQFRCNYPQLHMTCKPH